MSLINLPGIGTDIILFSTKALSETSVYPRRTIVISPSVSLYMYQMLSKQDNQMESQDVGHLPIEINTCHHIQQVRGI
jgi:hypothetical protein